MNEKRGEFKFVIIFLLGLLFVALFMLLGFATSASCWTYSTKTTCGAASTCKWSTDSWGNGWCEQLDCWSFYTQTDCQSANSTANLTCTWKIPSAPPGYCTEAYCWDFSGTNESVCTNTTKNYGLDCLWCPTVPDPNYFGYNCFGGYQCYSTGNNPPYTESQ